MTHTLEFWQEAAEKDIASYPVSNIARWLGQQTWSNFALSLASYYETHGTLTPKQDAAARSMMVKCTAKQLFKLDQQGALGGEAVTVPVGIHQRSDGTVVKVYTTQAGNLVGKVLVENIGIGGSTWEFDYRGKAGLKGLSTETLLPMEEARKFGRLTSKCVNCLRDLRDERSLAAGYGATCADNHGWWYPTMAQAMEIIAAEGLKVAA